MSVFFQGSHITWISIMPLACFTSFCCTLARFWVTSYTHKLAPEKTRPHFKSFKYDSEGEKSLYRVKNIKRMGETMYKFTLTKFPSKKMFFCQLEIVEVGASLLGGASLNVHELTRYPLPRADRDI